MKRLLAFVVFAAMILALAAPALAGESKQAITQVILKEDIPFESSLTKNIVRHPSRELFKLMA